MSKKLQDIRKKIDTLDNKIHDAIMERVSLINEVVAEKRKHNLPFVQPAREAETIRRILERHQGDLPRAAVVRIWRELISAVALLQVEGMQISVCVEDNNFITWDLAKSYFGSVVAMQRFSSPLTTIAAVREDEFSSAVLPWPSDNENNPWWGYLFDQDSDLKIVCALPYGSIEGEIEDIHDKALVVSKTDFISSGVDHSFFVLEVDRSVSRGRIADLCVELGMEPLSITTKARAEDEQYNLHLVEVRTYLALDDERLTGFTLHLEEALLRIKAVGGYPAPPVYQKGDIREIEKTIITAPENRKD